MSHIIVSNLNFLLNNNAYKPCLYPGNMGVKGEKHRFKPLWGLIPSEKIVLNLKKEFILIFMSTSGFEH